MRKRVADSLDESNRLFGRQTLTVAAVEGADAARAHSLYASEYSFLRRQAAAKTAGKEAIVSSASSAVEAAALLRQKRRQTEEQTPRIGTGCVKMVRRC